ncbi:MAG: tetratricopeptide repeat protein [Burkholderiaceae bacterium]|nr:tetratricopeptide repeat protein [Burkholderiaceae bacterium]
MDRALSDMLARVKQDALRVVGGDVLLVDTHPGTLKLEEEARAYLAQHDYPAAQAALGRLVLSFPDNAAYILELAASHQRLGRYDRALIYCEAALSMAPALSVYYHAAICHLGLDEPDAAADLLTAALARASDLGVESDDNDSDSVMARIGALLEALNDPYQDSSAPDR